MTITADTQLELAIGSHDGSLDAHLDLRAFPGAVDRRLLTEAVDLGCEVFLTTDYRSIVERRSAAPLPLQIERPAELLQRVLRRI
jgi:hypothetical protein